MTENECLSSDSERTSSSVGEVRDLTADLARALAQFGRTAGGLFEQALELVRVHVT